MRSHVRTCAALCALFVLAVIQAPGKPCLGLEPKAILKAEGTGVFCIAFSPDGKTLAAGCEDGSVRLWEVLSLRPRATLWRDRRLLRALSAAEAREPDPRDKAKEMLRYRIVTSVAFSPDGKTLAAGSVDRTIVLWDLSTGKAGAVLRGHTDSVRFLAFSPDGKLLASSAAGADNTIKLWQVATGREMARIALEPDVFHRAGFCLDGRTLATAGKGCAVRLWDTHTGKVKASLGSNDRLVCLAFSADGKSVAVGENENWRSDKLSLWETGPGRVRCSLKLPADLERPGLLYSCGFSPDGKLLLAFGRDFNDRPTKAVKCSMEAWLWDARSGEQVARLRGLTFFRDVWFFAFSPDGRLLAMTGPERTVLLWDLPALLKANKWAGK